MTGSLTTALAYRLQQNKVKPYQDSPFAVPKISSVSQRRFPNDIKAEQIFVRVTDQFSQESKDRGDDFLLATQIAQELEGLLLGSTNFALRQETAAFVFDIRVGAASTGSTRRSGSLVRLGVDFSIYDQTFPEQPVLKHGKVVYVRPHHRGMGRKSGEKSMRSILPVVARQLVSEVPIDATFAYTGLA
jgi:hypothetical protein